MTQLENETGNETPAPTPDVVSDSNSSASQDQPTVGQTGRAAPLSESPAIDRDAMALELLDEGKSLRTVQKEIMASVTPDSPSAEPQEARSGEATPAPELADAPSAPEAGHAGLDEVGKQQLSQTGLLPDAVTWNTLPATARQGLQKSAKAILAERTRLWQQGRAPRNERGQFVPGAGTQPADVRAQQQGDQAVAKPAAQSKGLKDFLKKFSDTVGEDVAAPLIEGLQEVLGQQAQESAERNQQLEQQRQQLQEQTQYVLQTQIRAEETNAWTELAKDVPEVATNGEAQEIIKEQAKVLAQAAYNTGAKWSWQNCLVQAGRMLLGPNIRQQEQAKLATARATTLRSTPERGNQQVSPTRAMSKEDKDRWVYEQLESGKTPQEVRMALAG